MLVDLDKVKAEIMGHLLIDERVKHLLADIEALAYGKTYTCLACGFNIYYDSTAREYKHIDRLIDGHIAIPKPDRLDGNQQAEVDRLVKRMAELEADAHKYKPGDTVWHSVGSLHCKCEVGTVVRYEKGDVVVKARYGEWYAQESELYPSKEAWERANKKPEPTFKVGDVVEWILDNKTETGYIDRFSTIPPDDLDVCDINTTDFLMTNVPLHTVKKVE